MAESTEETKLCGHCGKQVAAQSFMLHEIHCQRNFFKCVCGEFLNKSERESHEATLHKPEQCEHCRLTAPAYEMAKHKCQKLPKACTFCSAVIIFDDYVEHVKNCGNRTQLCPVCKKFVPTWQYTKHEDTCMPQDPEPVRPQPQKPNRFLQQERELKAKSAIEPNPVPAPRRKLDEEKKSVVRTEAVTKPTAKKPTDPVAKQAEPTAKPGRPVPTVPGKAAPVTKPGASVGTKGKQPVRKPQEVEASRATVTGKKAEEDDFDSDEGDGAMVKPREVIEDEDEELARVMAESMVDALPPSKPRSDPYIAKPSHTKPKAAQDEDEDEVLARAYAESMAVAKPPRQDPVVQPRTDRRVIDTSDATLARVIQESMGGGVGGEDWVADEDPELSEVILKSLREK